MIESKVKYVHHILLIACPSEIHYHWLTSYFILCIQINSFSPMSPTILQTHISLNMPKIPISNTFTDRMNHIDQVYLTQIRIKKAKSKTIWSGLTSSFSMTSKTTVKVSTWLLAKKTKNDWNWITRLRFFFWFFSWW